MTDFFFFDHNERSTGILEKYLKVLSNNPDSGVKCVTITGDKLQDFEDKRIKDAMELYDFERQQIAHEDVIGSPIASHELLTKIRKQRREKRRKK